MSLRDEVIEQAQARLGGETVSLELGEAGFNAAVDQALLTFTRYKPIMDHSNFKFTATGINSVLLPEDVIGIRKIDVLMGLSGGMFSNLALENALLSGMPVYYGADSTVMDITYLDYRRRWMATVARELNADPDWAYVQDPRTGRITVHAFATSQLYIDVHTFKKHSSDLGTIPYVWKAWFNDYVLAEAKLSLGHARSKFGIVPVAGTTVRLDGDSLIAEGSNEKARLINELQSSRTDLIPQWT